jgi:mannitol-1-phosphate 5-dehydrogenase
LIIKLEEKDEIINISNVRGVIISDEAKVIEEIVSADIVAVSVGLQGLKSFFPIMAKGLIRRIEVLGEIPIDIIVAENLRDAKEYFQTELKRYLPSDYPINQLVGLVETSIGKMVPIMPKRDMEDDILKVFAESYNNLILDKKGFRNPIPKIEGLSPKDNMKAWVDRKLFIHNLGHATVAYLGYLFNPSFIYLYEALAVPEIYKSVRVAMLQAAEILLKKYPDEFTRKDLTDHIDDLILRFQNKALGDTIFRVGSDLTRKLGPEDRMVCPVKMAREYQMPYDSLLVAIACACRFKAKDETGNRLDNDLKFDMKYSGNVRKIMIEVSCFNEKLDLDIINAVELLADRIDTGHYKKIIKCKVKSK